MKKTLVLMLSIGLIFVLAACGSTPEVDEMNIYADVLANVHDILTDPAGRAEFAPGEMGIAEAATALGDEALDTVGYVLEDVDGNGVSELLVGVFEKPEGSFVKNELYAVYTCKENAPVLLLEGTARNAYSLMDNGSFFHYGSNGAIYSIFGEFDLKDDGTLESKGYYFTYEKNEDGSEIGCYYNTTGEWDPAVSQEMASAEEFWAMEQQLADQTVVLQDTKFAQFYILSAN